MPRSAPVFDIQSLAVHDGEGLRTLVFLQGCPLRCSWCSNPEGQAAGPQMRWHAAKCSGCLACRDACTRGAVMAEVRDGRTVPAIDRRLCEACRERACLERCPTGALALSGRAMTAEALFKILRQDIRLYWNTGGGVTFGGGEPLLHPDFVADIAGRLRAYGVGTVVETCGEWDWEAAAPALEAAERIYFDLKTLGPEKHRRFTGRPNETILANLKRLAETRPGKMIISLPVIPGLSDTLEHAREIGALLAGWGLRRARLLPYHRLGIGKYETLGRAYPHRSGDRDVPPALVVAMQDALISAGLTVTVDG
ncbi:MAG: glycyl-radical enzyme activating protein [Acidobacteriota bacterium]|nr:glycyl-radical enzyme activating protein [Acidobacteriota bacterium]